MNNLLMCLLIIVGKIAAIGLYTFRVTLQIRGEKLWVAIIGVFCNLIDIFVLGYVVVFAKTNPMGMVCFAIGEVGGNLFGMYLDELIGIGDNIITVIINKDDIKDFNETLADVKLDGTYSIGKGFKDDRAVYKIPLRRKKEKELKKTLEERNISFVCFESSMIKLNSRRRLASNYGLKV